MTTQQKFWNDIGPTPDAGETLPRFLPTPSAGDGVKSYMNESIMKRVRHRVATGKHPKRKDGGTYQESLAERVQQELITGPLTSSVADSPAKISAMPDAVPDSTAKEVDCFSRPFAWFDNSDPDTSCWRTWQRSLQGGWIEYTGSWPRSVIVRNRIAYRLPPLVPHMSGIGFSSLPTPTANTKDLGTLEMKRHSGQQRQKGKPEAKYNAANGGQLNPEWVEWLMGFPSGWTDLDA